METFFVSPHKYSPEYTLVEQYRLPNGVVQAAGSIGGVFITVGSALPILLEGEHIVIFSGCEKVMLEAVEHYV